MVEAAAALFLQHRAVKVPVGPVFPQGDKYARRSIILMRTARSGWFAGRRKSGVQFHIRKSKGLRSCQTGVTVKLKRRRFSLLVFKNQRICRILAQLCFLTVDHNTNLVRLIYLPVFNMKGVGYGCAIAYLATYISRRI